MTSKKRRYGDLSASPLPSEDPGLLDDVFAAFTGWRPADAPSETPANFATPATDAGREIIAAPANPASPANEAPPARQFASPEPVAAPANSAAHAARPQADLFAGLPTGKGYLRLYYQLLDHLLPQLDPPDAIVYLHLYRLSWGFGSPYCLISNPGLARRAHVSERSVRDVTTRLIGQGLIEKVGVVSGAGKEQGIKYRVAIPAGLELLAGQANSAGLATAATNKEKALKENSKKGIARLTPEEIQSLASRVADLLREGKQLSEIESQFAPTMHPVDWATARSTALAQHQASGRGE